jgi:hypothetical protein
MPPPKTGVNAARAIVDRPFNTFLAKEDLAQIPSQYQGSTPREMASGWTGSMFMSRAEPLFNKFGFTRQDAEKVLKEPAPAPGKRSDIGTSDATDFSARSRTPPGTPGDVPLPQPGPRTENRNAAQTELNMTPEERALYDRHLGNLYGKGGVDNPDGSRSTLYQANVDIDGKSYNIPTVYDGKIVPVDEAVARAKQQGLDKFPSYPTPDAAEARYMQMHDYMDKDTGAYFQQHPGQPGAPSGFSPNTAGQQRQPGPGELPARLPGAITPVDVSKGQQITPEIAKALENAVKDQERAPSLQPPPGAQPVQLPSQVAPPMPGAPGGPTVPGPGGALMPGVAPQMMMEASQGNPIAMMGLSPIAPAPLSTPLTQQQPIPWTDPPSGGWGGWSGGGFDGGLTGGFSFGGGE